MMDLNTVPAVEWVLVNYMSRCAESIAGSIMDGRFAGDVQRVCAVAYKLSDRCEHIAQETLNQMEGRERMLAGDYQYLCDVLPELRQILPAPWVGSLPCEADMQRLRDAAIVIGVPLAA
jgi:hypothetical protein